MHENLIQLIERSKVAFPKFGNGVAHETIVRAEASLGIPLPNSYKWWLLNYGGGQIKGDIVYGLDEDGMGRPDIVELARMNERDGLHGVEKLVFSMGNGEYFYFDTTKLVNGEYQVFQHDISQDALLVYSEDFAEFLQKRIREVYRERNEREGERRHP